MSEGAFTPAQEQRLRAILHEMMIPLIEAAIERIAEKEMSLLMAGLDPDAGRSGGGLN